MRVQIAVTTALCMMQALSCYKITFLNTTQEYHHTPTSSFSCISEESPSLLST